MQTSPHSPPPHTAPFSLSSYSYPTGNTHKHSPFAAAPSQVVVLARGYMSTCLDIEVMDARTVDGSGREGATEKMSVVVAKVCDPVPGKNAPTVKATQQFAFTGGALRSLSANLCVSNANIRIGALTSRWRPILADCAKVTASNPLAVAYPFTAHIRMTQASRRRRLTATDEANGKAKAKVPAKRLLAAVQCPAAAAAVQCAGCWTGTRCLSVCTSALACRSDGYDRKIRK